MRYAGDIVPQGADQRLADAEGDADARQIGKGIARVGAVGIDDRDRLRQRPVGVRRVVIGDDDVDADLPRVLHLVDRAGCRSRS